MLTLLRDRVDVGLKGGSTHGERSVECACRWWSGRHGAGPSAPERQGVAFDVWERHRRRGWAVGPVEPRVRPCTTRRTSSRRRPSRTTTTSRCPTTTPTTRRTGRSWRTCARSPTRTAFVTTSTSASASPPTERTADGWTVTTTDGEVHDHTAALICATGTNWHAAMPTYPGHVHRRDPPLEHLPLTRRSSPANACW